MIPYDTDPSLHDAQPTPPVLGDGFSPPPPPSLEATDDGERPGRPADHAPQPAHSPF